MKYLLLLPLLLPHLLSTVPEYLSKLKIFTILYVEVDTTLRIYGSVSTFTQMTQTTSRVRVALIYERDEYLMKYIIKSMQADNQTHDD